MKNKILVVGGAGYIGSHVVKLLGEDGYEILILDNLSTGNKEAITYGELIVGELADGKLLDSIFMEHKIDAVMHFAGSIVVPESVEKPLEYYKNNTANALLLLQKCKEHKVENFIFSSTAAVYGEGANRPVKENDPVNPINPYGRSKLMVEWMLEDISKAWEDFNYITLRYFNVAGADPDGRIGQSSPICTHLIKRAALTALGKIDELQVFGTDYDTTDGTCIRDYIHITDLSQAHLDALAYLIKEKKSHVLNCGYGVGHSVNEVVATMKEVSGVDFKANPADRRAGDPPFLMSNPEKIKSLLGWIPKYDSLNFMVESALNWEKHLHKR
ncbi:MAG: UDP-glucose 4-epimerase GalE [Epsilonproteobacteria bacterium]|nr:MAG: UDP-glucose 4-epimerase GalE [Campylobacterota bacterium]RLA67775.1 MAG: UDP-glucose 4-epimerase GalE [Campylobacterota bacterium]